MGSLVQYRRKVKVVKIKISALNAELVTPSSRGGYNNKTTNTHPPGATLLSKQQQWPIMDQKYIPRQRK